MNYNTAVLQQQQLVSPDKVKTEFNNKMVSNINLVNKNLHQNTLKSSNQPKVEVQSPLKEKYQQQASAFEGQYNKSAESSSQFSFADTNSEQPRSRTAIPANGPSAQEDDMDLDELTGRMDKLNMKTNSTLSLYSNREVSIP